jgi:hypothetical protein
VALPAAVVELRAKHRLAKRCDPGITIEEVSAEPTKKRR